MNKLLSCCWRVLELTFSRIGGGDDGANRFLVEAFEAAVALEVFQVAAQGALAKEPVELLLRDQAGG